MSGKIILSLCDLTGNWPAHYRAAGYDVRQVDLQSGGDVRLLEYPGKVHGILAAPPCTQFAISGARWFKSRPPELLIEALSIVDACLRLVAVTKPQWWALENPVGILRRWLGPPTCTFNPCDFGGYLEPAGDFYTKRTLLWGSFNQPVPKPVPATEGSKMWRLYGGKSARTKNARSATPMGFAKAFFDANP